MSRKQKSAIALIGWAMVVLMGTLASVPRWLDAMTPPSPPPPTAVTDTTVSEGSVPPGDSTDVSVPQSGGVITLGSDGVTPISYTPETKVVVNGSEGPTVAIGANYSNNQELQSFGTSSGAIQTFTNGAVTSQTLHETNTTGGPVPALNEPPL